MQYTRKTRRPRILSPFWKTLNILIATVVLGFLIWILWRSFDIAPPTLTGYPPVTTMPPDQQNAIFWVFAAVEQARVETDPAVLLKPKQWNDTRVQQLIKKNRQSLEILSKAARMPQAVSMGWDSTPMTLEDYFKAALYDDAEVLTKLFALQRVQAELAFRQGQPERGWELLSESAVLGAQIAKNPASMFEYAIGMGAYKQATQQLLRSLTRGPNSKRSTLQFSSLASYEMAVMGDFKLQKIMIETVRQKGSLKPLEAVDPFVKLFKNRAINAYTFQPNRTVAVFAEAARTKIADLQACPPKEQYTRFVARLSQMDASEFSPNAVGIFLLKFSLPYDQYLNCRSALWDAVVQTQLAIHGYWKRNQRLPDQLADLPEFDSVFDPYAKLRTRLGWNKIRKELRSVNGETFRLFF
jgi:hypothetical protein